MPTYSNSGQTRTTFITVEDLRDNTVINGNVEGPILSRCIKVAQDKYVMPIIGGNLYSSLINKINAGTLTQTDINLLNGFIVPTLFEYTTYEAIPFLSLKFRNKGINKQTSPDSESASLEDLNYLSNKVLETAQFYAELAIRHLKTNASDYPDYMIFAIDQNSPASSDYFSGVHFPSDEGCCMDTERWKYFGRGSSNLF